MKSDNDFQNLDKLLTD